MPRTSTPPADVFRRPPGTIPYADGPRYKGGFGVPGDSNPRKTYVVSYDTAVGYWVCSCPGGIHHGHCKHLERYGLGGRRDADLAEQRQRVQAKLDAFERYARPVRPKFEPSPADAQPLPKLPQALTAPRRRFAMEDEI